MKLRTSHFAPGARASARFSVRPPAVSKTYLALNSIRPLKRRERRASIPTGLRPPAQGCEERATLGQRPAGLTNRNAVAAIPFSSAARGIGHNPVGVGKDLIPFPQGSSCVTTLDYMPESRWDSPNSLASATFSVVSFQPPAQFRRIPRAVENGYNGEDILLDRKVNTVSFEAFEPDATRPAAHRTEYFRIKLRFFQRLNDFTGKLPAQPRPLSFIPQNSLVKFVPSLRLKNLLEFHDQPYRCRSSVFISANEMPSCGFFSNSASRRSSSAACSGDNKGSSPWSAISSHKSCASRMRSSSGNALAACRISIVLMDLIYPVTGAMQMKTQPRPTAILS